MNAKTILFFWDNFGPTHFDRCEAVAALLPDFEVVGAELTKTSAVYSWAPESTSKFQKFTLLETNQSSHFFFAALALIRIVLRTRAKHVFLCHYSSLAVLISAMVLRILGRRVYTLIDSKFDDYARFLSREMLKAIWIAPYHGAVAGSSRTRQYLSFLGMRPRRIVGSYDSVSTARILSLANASPAPAGAPFSERHFTTIARLVPKKNLFTLIEAYSLYAKSCAQPRLLRIFGNGELEQALRVSVSEHGLNDLIVFEGFRQTEEICRALATSLALVHISTEEQFGFAVIEALQLGVPVIVSENCGARDDYVRTGVNGFLVEPDNPRGIAFFMQQISDDEVLWTKLAKGTAEFANQADASFFASAVCKLIET